MGQFLHFIGTIIRNPYQTGLALNFIGAIVIVFSIGKNREQAYQTDDKGREIYLASITHPVAIVVGIGFLILGFLLQFISTFI